MVTPMNLPEEATTFELHITLAPGKPITIRGPINNKPLCYMMLEEAKDVIREHCKKQAQGGIVQARAIPGLNGR